MGQDIGAWLGSIVDTTEGKVRLRTDQEKWERIKVWVNKLCMWLEEKKSLDFKELEMVRDFLIYVSRIYTEIIPYLKGLHQKIIHGVHTHETMDGVWAQEK